MGSEQRGYAQLLGEHHVGPEAQAEAALEKRFLLNGGVKVVVWNSEGSNAQSVREPGLFSPVVWLVFGGKITAF
jgi:hypothetical protein